MVAHRIQLIAASSAGIATNCGHENWTALKAIIGSTPEARYTTAAC